MQNVYIQLNNAYIHTNRLTVHINICECDEYHLTNIIQSQYLHFYSSTLTSNIPKDALRDIKLYIIRELMRLFDIRRAKTILSAFSPQSKMHSRSFWPLSCQKVSISLLCYKYLLYRYTIIYTWYRLLCE